jgi:hypothetical protein
MSAMRDDEVENAERAENDDDPLLPLTPKLTTFSRQP